MGRKKRKTSTDAAASESAEPVTDGAVDTSLATTNTNAATSSSPPPTSTNSTVKEESKEEEEEEVNKTPAASGYAMTSHSGEIVQEDIYVSDASSEEEAEGDVDFLLMGSKMGLMRRGLHHPLLVQPTHQWSRKDTTTNTDDDTQQQQQQQDQQQQEEEELAKLDPAQRAARLLAEKQRKLEEAKVLARRTESEENAGRDPCLFSKRTAFDIRFDQIDDKPWERPGSTGDVTDYFNYGLSEEDWLEYSQQQLLIRQELTDASRQRRPPDTNIVPVTPRTPHKQTPKVAVANTDTTVLSETHDETSNPADATTETSAVIGPVLVKQEPKVQQPQETKTKDVYANSAGGAWGVGAPPHLAQLIQDQEHVDHKDEWIKQEDDTSQPPQKPESSYSGSEYNPSARGDGSSEWNNSHPGSQGDWNHGGTNPGDWNSQGTWNSQGGDWNASRRRGSYGYEDAGGRPSYRGRGGYYAGGGRGSYGYGGRGGRGPRQYPPPHRGRGDPYGRKRPREDYSDRGGWRR